MLRVFVYSRAASGEDIRDLAEPEAHGERVQPARNVGHIVVWQKTALKVVQDRWQHHAVIAATSALLCLVEQEERRRES